jgi:hypothetical protein
MYMFTFEGWRGEGEDGEERGRGYRYIKGSIEQRYLYLGR